MSLIFDFVVLVLFPEPVAAELPLLDPVIVPDAEPVFLPVAVAVSVAVAVAVAEVPEESVP